MNDMHPLKEIVRKQKSGIAAGIYSACTANEYVIIAAMERAAKSNDYLLIEATANQVNQFGGYTGMTPVDFRDFIYDLAQKVEFPKYKIILGGDHLGPLTWSNEEEESAMKKSCQLINDYVLAGFTKIHIDTSMRLKNDSTNEALSTQVIARRGAILCEVAEEAYRQLSLKDSHALRPVYVVGSEVPIPGGSQSEEEGVHVTRVCDLEETIETFKSEFYKLNLNDAWENVIAIVVQPGVEFGDETIHEYNRQAARELCSALKKYPNLVFEGHSTDYQTPTALREMVEDGIAILKVGPGLTYALREGLFALNRIEEELFRYNPDVRLSNFAAVLDEAMLQNPSNWAKHYHGSGIKLRLARKYSLSDRSRYYLPDNNVKDSIQRLLNNLNSTNIPLTLISEFMPMQYNKIRKGELSNNPESLLKDRVVDCIDDYMYATKPNKVEQYI